MLKKTRALEFLRQGFLNWNNNHFTVLTAALAVVESCVWDFVFSLNSAELVFLCAKRFDTSLDVI